MKGIVLVIDDRERLGPVVQQALEGLKADLHIVDKVLAAKQFLVQTRPGVVISNVLLGENANAGFDFCREMRDHAAFASLPVILVGETLGEDVIRQATESGAHGLVGWPVAPETLRKRLTNFLDEGTQHQAIAADGSTSAAPPVQPPTPEMPVGQEATVDDKLKRAQYLLAMVLHSLKTSNLLEVVEMEDVPGIVMQMARTVCGEASGEQPVQANPKPNNAAAQQQQQSTGEIEVELNLDDVFGLKK